MSHSIKKIYVVHHSHTDIGYTDLQERVVDFQIDHIRSAIKQLNLPENKGFRWNCESYFCVEQFLAEATNEEKAAFIALVKEGRMGISGTYLNFCDLVDAGVLNKKTAKMQEFFKANGIEVKTAMIADINGISMGQRDVLIENGIEFLYTNIHTHHGMYPLYQNQNAYWWENADKKRLLVWNGEHYNLGNALGLKPNKILYYMEKSYFGEGYANDGLMNFNKNLEKYLDECENHGYPYDFLITSVSGVFSDNAPPNQDILRMIEMYSEKFGKDAGIEIKMVTLAELYANIKGELKDLPVCHGDLTDWWANGAGSTPGAVKHYREAQHMYNLVKSLDSSLLDQYKAEATAAEDNLLIYAEHTWGHSSTITNPYDTFVLNLDMRKNSYASKAHEASAKLLNKVIKKNNGTLSYYNTTGKIKAVCAGKIAGKYLVEFYLETPVLSGAKVISLAENKEMTVQLSSHPRGILISFVDSFNANQTKEYSFEEIPAKEDVATTRVAYMGAERVRDIVNDYDKETYTLPYYIENEWLKVSYEIGKGVTSFYNKEQNCEMLSDGFAKFFTPVYQRSELRKGVYSDRALLGRNIRATHAEEFAGILTSVNVIDRGEVFINLELEFKLEGTEKCMVLVKLYREMPRIDFTLRIAKKISDNIENVFMPINLELANREVYIKKGTEPFRPGIDQIPGTGMEYYMSDLGVAYIQNGSSVIVTSQDVPLLYMGSMKHHQITLCDGKKENNQRDVYSWVMNNTWETNFKMDLSGYYEFCYSVELAKDNTPFACFERIEAQNMGIFNFMVE